MEDEQPDAIDSDDSLPKTVEEIARVPRASTSCRNLRIVHKLLTLVGGDFMFQRAPVSIWQLRPILLAVALVLFVFAAWNWIFVLAVILMIFGCDFLAQH